MSESRAMRIAADQVQPDDEINVGGIMVTVTVTQPFPAHRVRFALSTGNYLHFDKDDMIWVYRPIVNDPKEEALVKAVANELAVLGGWSCAFEDLLTQVQANYMTDAKELLAAIRETHEVMPRAEA